MQRVLEHFENFEFYVNLKKCKFNIEKIEFLNFVVFTKEIRMNSKRIQIIKKWLKLKIYREVQLFLKFVNFYKYFIYCYFKIITSLTSLFKNSENEKRKVCLFDRIKSSKRFVSSRIFLCSSLFLFIMTF